MLVLQILLHMINKTTEASDKKINLTDDKVEKLGLNYDKELSRII